MEPNNNQSQPQDTNPEQQPVSPGVITPAEPNNFQPQVPQQDNKKPGKKLVIILALLLVLVLVGAGAYLFLNKDDSENTANNQQTADSSEQVSVFDPPTKFPVYAQEIQNEYPYINFSESDMSDGRRVLLYSDDISHYVEISVPDKWGGMLSEKSDVKYSGTGDANEAPYNSLITKMKNDGFTEYSFEKKPTLDGMPIPYFRNGSIVCSVSKFSPDRVFYNCIDESDLEARANFVEPYYELYLSEYPEEESNTELVISVDESSIAKSNKFKEYETLELYSSSANDLGGKGVYFYRISNGEWTYSHIIRGDSPVCSQFSEDKGAQMAFADTECYGDEQNAVSTVTVSEYFSL